VLERDDRRPRWFLHGAAKRIGDVPPDRERHRVVDALAHQDAGEQVVGHSAGQLADHVVHGHRDDPARHDPLRHVCGHGCSSGSSWTGPQRRERGWRLDEPNLPTAWGSDR
jgi:hypothetical protein